MPSITPRTLPTMKFTRRSLLSFALCASVAFAPLAVTLTPIEAAAASNIKLSATARNAMLDAITTAIGTSGTLTIYDGTQPATVATSITTQNVLAVLALSSAFAPSASSGVLTANTITNDSSADATGTAAWFSLKTSGGTRVYEGSVGTSGADLNLNTTSIVAAGPVAVTSFTITAPGA